MPGTPPPPHTKQSPKQRGMSTLLGHILVRISILHVGGPTRGWGPSKIPHGIGKNEWGGFGKGVLQ